MARGPERTFLTAETPYPEFYREARSATRRELLRDLWDSPSGRRIGRTNITVLDTFRLEGDAETVLLERLGVSREEVEDVENAKTKELFANINQALLDAHSYLVDYLNLQLPAVLKKPAQVQTFKELVALLEKTALYGPESRKHLGEHAGYCDYFSVALATYELQKAESKTLEDEVRYVEDTLTRMSEVNNHAPFLIPVSAGEQDGKRVYKVAGLPECRVTVAFREKSATSQITKFLMKAEASAKEALKDAIGMRIEGPKDQLGEVLHMLLPFLTSNFDAEDITVENVNTLDVHEMKELETLVATSAAGASTSFKTPDANSRSSQNFQALKVLVSAQVPEQGISGNMTRERMIEVQLVPDNNKNESGLRNHDVYDLKKKIDVVTRLHGGCSAVWLEKQARDIPIVGGPKWEKIRDELLREKKIIPLPGKNNMYGSADVYLRWYKSGLLPEGLRPQIAHALSIQE